MEQRILVVDDEVSIAQPVTYAFRREGYVVETAHDGEEALRKAEWFKPHVIVLDVMMPKLNGYEVCRRLDDRENIGIVLLTVKNDIVDKVLGLELGADDYMTKPFDLRELISRVKALLRRLNKGAKEAEQEEIRLGGLILHTKKRTAVYRDPQLGDYPEEQGTELELTPKEFDLLVLLCSHPERVYTRDELLDLVWSMDYAGGTRTVDIHIQRLRKKIGENGPGLLQTVYGVGYKAVGAAR
ncbi:response regulator transcription factor [Paenibacillus gansuensis]|uniref:Response regulator transcription factor n=1 Tax=Paenibacillus gansuensis TaxID=306542 RepID=A0ABW5PJ49_9BACL